MLTEQEVQRSFRKLFSSRDFADSALGEAETLLEQLRAESPLRHRLGCELDELRKLSAAKN